ncbi:MAG: hypothetical protein IPK97_15735 [Ahniella sp.]|nr:hypothetical protein [Ahniella sp.]
MIQRLWTTFQHTGERIENWNLPFHRFLVLFAGLLTIRLVLEFFSNQRLFQFSDVIHIGLWFCFVVLAFMALLQAFSGQTMLRTARLVITCYVFSWSAPLIDLMLFQGNGVRMNYLAIASPEQMAFAYLTIGGPSIMRGATIGIRIEIVCLVLACFAYVFGRTRSVLRAGLAAWLIYTMLFMTGTIPYLLTMLVSSLGLQYRPDDQSTVLLLLSLDLWLLAWCWFRFRRGEATRMDLGPMLPVAGLLLAATVGAVMAARAYPDNRTLDPSTLFWPFLITWIIAAGWYGWRLLEARIHGSVGTAIWILSLGTIGLIEPRLLLGVQLLFSLVWIWRALLAQALPASSFAVLAYPLLVITSTLLGYQLMGGPMIGLDRWSLSGLFGVSAVLTLIHVRRSALPHRQDKARP